MSKSHQFKFNLVSLSLFTALSSPTLYAEEVPVQQLSDVHVIGNKKVHRKDNEVTGLGKIVKTSESLNKEQILNIRDLTRYDPGISVVEQGRGASAGYSIRGVDRNRVALTVDGLPQIQSYEVLRSNGGSGAINEIEYENVRSIEISKGASSAEYGSGALGGAVGFATKEAKDIIKSGKSWGLTNKTAYSSKNKQWMDSLAFAGQHNGFDALVVYTHRKGKELQVHKDAGNQSYQIRRPDAYIGEYELLGTLNEKARFGWFKVEGEEGDPKHIVKQTRPIPFTRREVPPLSPEEEKDYLSAVHRTETLSADNYTGENRIKPNPMDYSANSWLVRLGYQFTPRHYVGGVFEHTKQGYDIRDMTVPAYFTEADAQKNNRYHAGGNFYTGNNILDGVFMYNSNTSGPQGLRWTRTEFVDEQHRKVRKGLLYRYANPDRDTWVDNASLTLDRQEIKLDNLIHKRHCSVYPTVDKNCRPSLDKLWSFYESERNTYSEKHSLVKLNLDKNLKWGVTKHNLGLLTGLDKFSSALNRGDFYYQYVATKWTLLKNGLGTFDDPNVYRREPSELITKELCNWVNPRGLSDCSTRKIKGYNTFLSLRDHISFGKYVDLGIGGRYDYHKMQSDDKWTGSGKYRTFSWNTGLVVKPTKNISLSYRVSTGFRIPSFQEQFGFQIFEKGVDDDVQYVSKLAPEKAFNQELGIALRGDLGAFETSVFKNDYKDIIALAKKRGLDNGNAFSYGYHNAQEIQLTGVNVLAKIDWNGIWDSIPEGIYTSFVYNKIKPKRVKNDPNYTNIRSPLLDSLQPSRYVVGLGYDEPEEKWGITGLMTYSKGKSNAELIGSEEVGKLTIDATSTKKRTKSWRIYDVVGYVNIKDFLTLRAGVYNLFNTRYVTWESVRQSSVNSLNRHQKIGSYERYAAPGRNYTLSVEMKF